MRLIIVDGLDGVGKDTHAGLIKKRYESMDENVVVRSHPESDTFFGIKTKKALLGKGKINKLKASMFYMFDVLRSIKKYCCMKDIDTLIMVRYLVGTAYLPGRLARIGYRFFYGFVPMIAETWPGSIIPFRLSSPISTIAFNAGGTTR